LPFQRACILVARTPHSGDWLLALPVTACGHWFDDKAVHIAVALRLGSGLGSPRSCHCGSLVDATGTHGLVCKHVPSRVVRHHALNECISRAFSAVGILVKKEPAGLFKAMVNAPTAALLFHGMWR